MKKSHRKFFVIAIIIIILVGNFIVFFTPNKLASRIYLSVLKLDFEATAVYLSEHQEVSSIYYIPPSSSQAISSAFMLMMNDGETRYSTGDSIIDASINKIICSYQFNTIRASGGNVFFYLNRFSTHFSNTLYGIQYAPLDKPTTFVNAPIKSEKIQDNWYYFVELDTI